MNKPSNLTTNPKPSFGDNKSHSQAKPEISGKHAPPASKASPKSLLHSIEDQPVKKKSRQIKTNSSPRNKPIVVMGISLAIVLAGSVTGFGLSRVTSANGSLGSNTVTGVEQGSGKIDDKAIKKGQVFGDPTKSGDLAQGVLKRGGVNGEGSHRILRPGGPSKTVYLTSSVVNLDDLVGHEVKVWGDTFSAQSAGWLMDVLTVEVVQLDAPEPFDEDE